jgi:uncharacterized protein YbbC (DUF1343 family)
MVEGPVRVDHACSSFIGRKPIAIRHGMTIGELARLFNAKFVPGDNAVNGRAVELTVVPMVRRCSLNR